jgi:hypothetical protein
MELNKSVIPLSLQGLSEPGLRVPSALVLHFTPDLWALVKLLRKGLVTVVKVVVLISFPQCDTCSQIPRGKEQLDCLKVWEQVYNDIAFSREHRTHQI